MRRFAPLAVLVVGFVMLTSSSASAQATIAGLVKDTSGAVLPGVTVEAASSALIEKTRSVVTDGSGQFNIVNLRPGSYVVTFALPGFNTVKREGIELTGSFTATVNIEMKVGSIEETITVTGETPLVDLQSATRERVMDSKVLAEIPTGRVFANYAVLVPGISQTNSPDVGGSLGANMTDLIAHGSRSSDFRMMVNGVSLSTNAGGRAGAVPNISAYQEVAIDAAAVDASQAVGGPRVNFIPRDGGNTTKGTGFFGFANSSFQGNNFTQRLKDLGLTTPNAVRRIWDFNPGIGGPIKKDKLWYFVTYRNQGAYNNLGGLFYNKSANNPTAWSYDPDLTRPEVNQQLWDDGQGRLTYQASPKNKLALSLDFQDINSNWPFGCDCVRGAISGGSITLTSPEANSARRFPLQRALQADWTSPVTSRLLLEAVAIQRVERFVTDDNPGGGRPLQLTDNSIIAVTDRGGPIPGLAYRAPATYGNTWMWSLYFRTGVSYITGEHSVKFGLDGQWGHNDALSLTHVPYSYTFNSPTPVNGVYVPTPNQITLRISPTLTHSAYGPQLGVYAQDKWTKGKLTVSGGVRYDHFGATVPANSFDPTQLAPTLSRSFPEEPGLGWNDLSPKLSAVYDLFGNGKTAIKTSLNRYLSNQTNFTTGAKFTNVVTSTNRSWNDLTFPVGDPRRGNYIPDCVLTNLQKNGECGLANNTGFGTYVESSSSRDPELSFGWFKRSYNWEFSLGVQREVLPRVSMDVSYFRRIYGNFTVTDDLNVKATDYTTYNVIVPTDSRLPTSGQTITGLSDLNTDKFGQPTLNYTTFSDKYGNQTEHWNGVDVSMNARLHNGLLLQGGVSTGRTSTDNCDIRNALPEIGPSTPLEYCHADGSFVTHIKLLGAYTIPKIAVLVSGTYQSIPGPEIAANRVYPSAEIKPFLGRDLSAGATQNVTINLIPPVSMYGERVHQVDFRVGKVLNFGRIRATANLDVFNILNADTVINENSTYSAWRTPTEVMQARLAKISLQWDF